MSDVLNRLRIFLHKNCAQYFAGSDIMREAADEIERQQQRIRELEEALRQVRSEYNGIPYAQWSATMHRVNDVLERSSRDE